MQKNTPKSSVATKEPEPTVERFMRLAAVVEVTGLPASTLYEMMQDGRFPRRIKLSARAVGWRESDIAKWQAERIALSR